MSLGKFCANGDDRRATFTPNGGILWHEEAKEIEIDRVRNHYELKCWIKPARVSRVVSPSGSTGKPERHVIAVPQRADYETPMGLFTQGADVPRVYEGSMEGSTMLPEGSQIRCEDKSRNTIARTRSRSTSMKTRSRKHKVTFPAVPRYNYLYSVKEQTRL